MLHVVPIHPGSQVQTSGAVHTPFSHEELHIAIEGVHVILCYLCQSMDYRVSMVLYTHTS